MHPSREPRRRYASVPINASSSSSTPFSNDANKFDRSPSYFLPSTTESTPGFARIEFPRMTTSRRRMVAVPWRKLHRDNRLVFVSTNVISCVPRDSISRPHLLLPPVYLPRESCALGKIIFEGDTHSTLRSAFRKNGWMDGWIPSGIQAWLLNQPNVLERASKKSDYSRSRCEKNWNDSRAISSIS